MLAALGPRFALEAGFIVLLAAVLGFADLSPALIILIMALAWVLVSSIEYFAWRQGPRLPPRFVPASEPAAPTVQREVVVEEPAAAKPALPPAPITPPAEEPTAVQAPAEQLPEAGSREESVAQAGERVEAARLAFGEEGRIRHRLEPLPPRPRRRWGIIGPRERPGGEQADSSEEER